MAMEMNEHGVQVVAPPADSNSKQTAECVVLDTFTKIYGNKRNTYGLLFKVETHEFMMAMAENVPQVLSDGEIPVTKWAILIVEQDHKTASDRFYAAKLGLIDMKQTGVVTVIV